ncbi:MAG: NAD(P)/FAD-dependent oxidoreductase [Caldisericaceae bacterium]|nr:NAD(P)/FAD-dependent oxidoreductase [Caldisericaceae bacterium]
MERNAKQKYDVLICGAGIAGSIAAKLLAKKGISVLLLEKDEYSGKTNACGGLFDRPYFNRYVKDGSVLEQSIKKNVFFLPWGKVVFDCDQVTVKRRIFDRYLAEQAKAAGAKLMNRQKVVDYQVKKAGQVLATVKDVNTKMLWQVEVKIIVFADGPNSLAFKNPVFQKQLKKQYWAYAYAYEIAQAPVPSDEVYIYFLPDLYPWGYGWIFPNKLESNIGVGSILPELDKEPLKQKLFYFIESFKPTAKLLQGRKIVDKKGGYIPMWMLNTLSDDSQLLLGDAAGMVSPLFGAGIDYAIEAAEASAPVIEKAIKTQNFSATSLKDYDQQVEKRFGLELKKQMLLARIIIFSKKFGKLWPVKILAVVAFGSKYTRWNKIKILAYPWLGKPTIKSENQTIDHK